MKSLRVFLVVALILGYALILAYCCIESIRVEGEEPSFPDSLIYVANVLCGLIGGITAAAFGVRMPDSFRENRSRYRTKMGALGNFVVTWKLQVADDDARLKELLGRIYAWGYCLTGLAAIVIWIIDDVPHDLLKTIATVSLGLFLVVGKNYLSD
jgi:hypothetical protein